MNQQKLNASTYVFEKSINTGKQNNSNELKTHMIEATAATAANNFRHLSAASAAALYKWHVTFIELWFSQPGWVAGICHETNGVYLKYTR